MKFLHPVVILIVLFSLVPSEGKFLNFTVFYSETNWSIKQIESDPSLYKNNTLSWNVCCTHFTYDEPIISPSSSITVEFSLLDSSSLFILL